jgi:hypothetical protein
MSSLSSSSTPTPTPTPTPFTTTTSTSTTANIETIPYHCGKCRASLFTSAQLLSHEIPTDTIRGFANKRNERPTKSVCSSHFLDPNGDLQIDQLCASSEPNGPVQCPLCHQRIGAFDWSGSQCSCGEWVVPSFYVIKSKVDGKIMVPIHVVSTTL